MKLVPPPPRRHTCTKRRVWDKDNEWWGRLALGFIGQDDSLWCGTPFWWWAVWGRCCTASHSLHSGDPGGGQKAGEVRHDQRLNILFSPPGRLAGLLVKVHWESKLFGVLRKLVVAFWLKAAYNKHKKSEQGLRVRLYHSSQSILSSSTAQKKKKKL